MIFWFRAELEQFNKPENFTVMKIQPTFYLSLQCALAIDEVLPMKKVRKLLAVTVMLLVLIAAAVRGQSADGFDPNANSAVNVVVVQPDGKILLGGTVKI
jgi:hypothetical protein